MSELSREQHLMAAQRALESGDPGEACDHLRDVLENEFEPRIASAISRIEAGDPVALDELIDAPIAFDDVPESGIDADLFGMELVVEDVEPEGADTADANDAGAADPDPFSFEGLDDGDSGGDAFSFDDIASFDEIDGDSGIEDPLADADFEEKPVNASPKIPSRVRYRGVAPPPPVHRSRTSDSWLAQSDTVAPDEPPASDPAEDSDLGFDDWDFGGSPNASASSATIERQQVGFDELEGAMQPSGHLPGMRDAFVDPEPDDGAMSALPAELVPETVGFVEDPVSAPPGAAETRPPVEMSDATMWADDGGTPVQTEGETASWDAVEEEAAVQNALNEPDPFDAFAESRLADMLDAGPAVFDPAPADAGAAATFDVRMRSRPRHPVVPDESASEKRATRPSPAVPDRVVAQTPSAGSEPAPAAKPSTPPRVDTARMRWEPDVERAERSDSPTPMPMPAAPSDGAGKRGRTGRTLSGWRSGSQVAVPDTEAAPSASEAAQQPATPAAAGPSAAQIEATRAAFARQSSIDRRTEQGSPAHRTQHPSQQDDDAAAISNALMEVSDFFIVGELDKASARLDELAERWPGHPDIESFRGEVEKARGQRLLELLEPLDRVPMANAQADAEALAALNPRRMFIVSLADGMATVEDLIDMSGMPQDQARVAIASLIDLGVLVFDD